MEILNWHAAARIIKSKGEKGFPEAVRLVGRDGAMGMLVFYLRERDNFERWDEGEVDDSVTELLRQCGLI